MTTVALVPLNARAQMKTRLAPLLNPEEREALALSLATRVLGALRASPFIGSVFVVSPDRAVLNWAEQRGAQSILQAEGDLNAGLELGRREAIERGATQLLVVLADLPLLTPNDIAILHAHMGDGSPNEPDSDHVVVLAPDRARLGTNALLVRPADAMPFAFGEDSLARHRGLALRAGIRPQMCWLNGTGFDVDTPADVDELRRREAAWHVEYPLVGGH